MSLALGGPRKASYVLMAVGLFAIVRFNLAPALLAGLFSYMILDQSNRRLRTLGAGPLSSRWASVAVLLILAGGLGLIFQAFLHIGISRMPQLLDRATPRVDAITRRFGLDLQLTSAGDLRALIMDWVRENYRAITAASGLLTRGFFQIVIAVVAATLYFLSPTEPRSRPDDLHTELLDQISDRVSLFVASFERVIGAQLLIASINAFITAVFLYAVDMPFKNFLTLATFVCGVVPIVGNIASNALICAAAVVRSEQLAVAALVFLVVVHKAEYFLNSRIVGAAVAIPMWATLLGNLAGEVLMGVPGVLLAPTLLYYVRTELQLIPLRDREASRHGAAPLV